jgi:hypothetical protein
MRIRNPVRKEILRRGRIRTAMPEVGQLLVDALLLHLHLEDLQRLLQVLLLVHQLVEPSAHKEEHSFALPFYPHHFKQR